MFGAHQPQRHLTNRSGSPSFQVPRRFFPPSNIKPSPWPFLVFLFCTSPTDLNPDPRVTFAYSMNEASNSDPPESGRSARPKAHGFFRRSSNPAETSNTLPLTESSQSQKETLQEKNHQNVLNAATSNNAVDEKSSSPNGGTFNTQPGHLAAAASAESQRPGSLIEPQDGEQNTKPKRPLMEHIRKSAYLVITHSWLNLLLIFVPVGIAVAEIDGIPGGVVFGMNAIAIIPLAGLLAFATESVARKMGDALGALLNVTFGNAVELIIL